MCTSVMGECDGVGVGEGEGRRWASEAISAVAEQRAEAAGVCSSGRGATRRERHIAVSEQQQALAGTRTLAHSHRDFGLE